MKGRAGHRLCLVAVAFLAPAALIARDANADVRRASTAPVVIARDTCIATDVEFTREVALEGRIEMRVRVDEHGRVVDHRFRSHIPMLDATAAECVKRWRFEPARRDGRPVTAWTDVVVIVHVGWNRPSPSPSVEQMVGSPERDSVDGAEAPSPATTPVRKVMHVAPRADVPEPISESVPGTTTYPRRARAAKVEGTVMVEALVDVRGRVVRTRVLKSIPLLDDAACRGVKQWRFRPATKDGKAIAAWAVVPVTFALH